jgi:hypothetical protein
MSVMASVVVSTALFVGGVQFDGDATGRGMLAWNEWPSHKQYVVRTVDVVAGRPVGPPRELMRSGVSGDLDLFDLDVAPSGAGVMCLRQRKRPGPWRIRIIRRAPGRAWSKPVLVARERSPGNLACATGDSGQVVLTWSTSRGRMKTASVGPDGDVSELVTLARRWADTGQLGVAPDGTETAVYTVQDASLNAGCQPDHPERCALSDRALHVAQRPPNGTWSTRAIASASSPQFAIDGMGREVVAWAAGDSFGTVQQMFAAGPSFAPVTLANELGGVEAVAASTRGDIAVVWHVESPASPGDVGPHPLRVALQRPGEGFGEPVTLGSICQAPVALSLAGDGSGAVAWPCDTQITARLLNTEGVWGPPIKLPSVVQLVAAPGGRVNAAWLADARGTRRSLRVGQLG